MASSKSTGTTITNLLVPTYKQNLTALLAWLDKASVDDASLSKRLAPDMFPLATQIRFVCLQAQEAVYRLQGKEIPKELLDLGQEGRAFGELPEDTLVSAKARIQEALDFLIGLEADALDKNSNAERKLTIDLPNGMKFELNAHQYVRDWALPQFYFHVVTAYSILRNSGLELGKADYVPHMFAYLQAPPEPPAESTEKSES